MPVFVVVCVDGYDPADVRVWTFGSAEAAAKRKAEIEAATKAYWRSVIEAGEAIRERWTPWLDAVCESRRGRGWPADLLASYQRMAGLVANSACLQLLARSIGDREHFLSLAAAVAEGGPEPPPLPELLPPPPDCMVYHGYQLSIHETEVQS